MKVLKPNRLSCLTRPYRYLNNDYLAITACLMVDFSSECALETEQQLWKIFNEESILNFGAEALDFGIPKRKPEIIVNGYGFGEYAVNGRAAVSVSVNNVRKDLWVTGDRYWSDGKPSKPAPFDKIAINWRNAYGGEGFAENPQGKGYRDTEVQGLRVRWLPNIEDPAHPVVHEGRRYAPAGYAAIHIESPGRNLLLGTYDDHWRVHEFPGFARDIDWEYFNQSPARQRLNRLEAGDSIAFTHLHPEKEILTTTIPPLVAKVFIKRIETAARDTDFLEEVPLQLTTYWAYPHLEKAILLFQGAAPVGEDDASDVSHILYCAEHSDAPKTRAEYEEIFHQRVNLETGPLYALFDKQLVDSRFIRRTSLDEVEVSPLLQNKLKKLERELRENAELSEADDSASEVKAELAWLKKSQNGKIERSEIIEEMIKRLQQEQSAAAIKKQFRKRPQGYQQRSEEASQALKNERQNFLKTRREALLTALKENAEQTVAVGAGPQGLASDAAQGQLRQLRLQQLDQFAEIVSGVPTTSKAKRTQRGSARNLYRIFGLNQFLTEAVPEGYDGYELHGFSATRVSFSGQSLDGLAIRESHLSGCDFTKTRMTQCDVDQVVFNGCDFSSVDWTKAHFRQCQFIDCRFPDVQSDKARFEDCRFVRSELTTWMHFKITLKNCAFQHCRFANFSYMRGSVDNVNFENCHFLRHAFLNGSVKGLRLQACQIDSMSFVGIKTLHGWHVSQCQISKLYVAAEIALHDAEISYSTISNSSFRKVRFDRGSMLASDLSACDFSEATLRDVRLEGSFFKQSLFIRADLSEARVTNCDFSETQMKSADVTGAHMRHVSFFSADLSMIKADANTVQRDMLMDRSNVYPLRK